MSGRDSYYFGCWRDSGHYLWAPGRCSVWGNHDCPWQDYELDAKLAPGTTLVRGRHRTPHEQPEGIAALHHKDGWTAIAFWDRSVDRRSGSNSAFILRGTHSFDETLRLARDAFPEIFARFAFEIREFHQAQETP